MSNSCIVPSMKAIYEHLLAQEAEVEDAGTKTSRMPSVAVFLQNGVEIQDIQYVSL